MRPQTLTITIAAAASIAAAAASALAAQDTPRDTGSRTASPGATALADRSRDSAADTAVMHDADSGLSRADYDTTEIPSVSSLRVTAVGGEGSMVTLEDGTIWQTYLPDRPDVATWKPGDQVIVRLAPIGHGERFTYELENARRDAIAVVALRGRLTAGD